jgi:hypothetical protein
MQRPFALELTKSKRSCQTAISEMASRGAQAIQLAVETSLQAASVEDENKELRAQLQKNLDLIENFEVGSGRARALEQQLRDKEAKLSQKRSELISVQAAIIATLKVQGESPPPVAGASLEVIPLVIGKVQKSVTTLTEAAIEQKTISIPILSLFKVSESLHQLYDALAEKGVIEETDDEKRERIHKFVSSQKEILTGLKAIAERFQASAQRPRVEEERDPSPKATQGDAETAPDST